MAAKSGFLVENEKQANKEAFMKPKYKRVLLKLSGEALSGDKGFGINNDIHALNKGDPL